MIKNFSQYIIEEERSVFFTFGRMNPPTIGHGKVMDALAQKSGKSDYKVFVSQTQDAKKNPLSYSDKIKHVRKMFPKHARQVMVDKKVKTAINALVSLYDQGYRTVTMVVGDDRLREFDVLFNKYNGQQARHGFYNFKSINLVSAGKRDPDAEGIEGMSASKQRETAASNDFVAFSQGVPKSMSNADARRLFNDVRKGMGLKEASDFRNHLELESVSEIREKFVLGELFSVGDEVVVKDSDELATVAILGTNYVIIETHEGKKLRKWLDAVELVEKKEPCKGLSEDDPCWKTHKQVGMKTKNGKQVPNCVPKESTSIEEEVSQKEINDLEKFGDRLLNKFDVDIEFTKHFADRLNDKRNKPSISTDEIKALFQKMADNKGKRIKKHANQEAILKDMQTDLNLPVVINWKNGEFEVVNKTIMRKKAFKSPDPQIKYEGTRTHKTFLQLYNEEGGAGEEGTDKLKKKYTKDTPHMTVTEDQLVEDWVKQLMSKISSKTINKDKYTKVARYIKKQLDTGNYSSPDFAAADTVRKFNLDINVRVLANIIRELM